MHSESQKITFQYLHERLDLAPLLAKWIYKEFWTDISEVTEESILERFKETKSKENIPLTKIVFLNDEPVGTVSLIESDDDERTHLKPWLAALYVESKVRKLGLGKALTQNLLLDAKRLGIKKLYLGTDKPEFYIKQQAKMYEDPKVGLKILYFEL